MCNIRRNHVNKFIQIGRGIIKHLPVSIIKTSSQTLDTFSSPTFHSFQSSSCVELLACTSGQEERCCDQQYQGEATPSLCTHQAPCQNTSLKFCYITCRTGYVLVILLKSFAHLNWLKLLSMNSGASGDNESSLWMQLDRISAALDAFARGWMYTTVKNSWGNSWAVRPNEPSGFHGRKAILNHASALVSACP